MGKKDEYRFNLRFDETDEMHRLVVKYLNSCGHNKAKYIALYGHFWHIGKCPAKVCFRMCFRK